MFLKVMKLKNIIAVFLVISAILSVLIFTPEIISVSNVEKEEKTEIKWVDFSVSYEALSDCLEVDIKAHNEGKNISWIELLAYFGVKYGGDFKRYKKSDLIKLCSLLENGENIKILAEKYGNYDYYKEAYGAVLDGLVGEYEIETEQKDDMGRKITEKKYGLVGFSPIAKGYSYSHYDDFGSARSYGFRRKHLGHDLMGSIGTPIVAVESGVVECVGWNRYGGWRIGIRSFDKKRYYYYAHLRKDHPYNDMYEGKIVKAGDVIGYLGMTGYSTKENVNNINVPHLHYGMQLIFDESKKDESYEIWIDMYALTKLLERNKSAVYKKDNEYYRTNEIYQAEAAE